MEEPDRTAEFEETTGIRFRNPDLLKTALTHSSAKSADRPCNERLEFLGDSILGLVIAEVLFRDHPDFDEGDLTRIKSEVVSSRTLACVGDGREFTRYLRVGKGLRVQRNLPSSLVAGFLEALIGAIYLDRGLEAARGFILDLLGRQIENVLADRHRKNFKSILQTHSQKHFGLTPTYRVVAESGPDHGKTFEVEARIGHRRFPAGSGRSKKEAEQNAAELAMAALARPRKTPLPEPGSEADSPQPAARKPEPGAAGRLPASWFPVCPPRF